MIFKIQQMFINSDNIVTIGPFSFINHNSEHIYGININGTQYELFKFLTTPTQEEHDTCKEQIVQWINSIVENINNQEVVNL